MYVLLKEEVWWVQHLKGMRSLFAAASQNLKPVWFLLKSKSTYRFFKNGYIIKCVIEIKQGVWCAQSPESMSGYTLQSTNDMHPPVRITSETIGCLVY